MQNQAESSTSAQIKCHLCINCARNNNSHLCPTCVNLQQFSLEKIQYRYKVSQKSTKKLQKQANQRINMNIKQDIIQQKKKHLQRLIAQKKEAIEKKKKQLADRWTQIECQESTLGLSLSVLEQKKQQMQDCFISSPIWDERDQGNFDSNQNKLRQRRQKLLNQAFKSLQLPSVAKQFPDWSVQKLFQISEQKLFFRLSDEFDMIDSNELIELQQTKKENVAEDKKAFLISDDFQVQIDFNYINGMSPFSEKKQEQQDDSVFYSALAQSQAPAEEVKGGWVSSLAGDKVGKSGEQDNLVKSQVNMDVIGKSEFDQLQVSEGVTIIPIRVLRFQNVDEFQNQDQSNAKRPIFPLKSQITDLYYNSKSSKLRIMQSKHEKRAQRALHMACSLIQAASHIAEIELPYPLILTPFGFTIATSDGQTYPLFPIIEAPLNADEEKKLSPENAGARKEKVRHIISLEMGAILLDKNIQYLLFVSRHPLIEGEGTRKDPGNLILNFTSLRERIPQLSQGLPTSVPKKDLQSEHLGQGCKEVEGSNQASLVFPVATLRQQHLKKLVSDLTDQRTPEWVKQEQGQAQSGIFNTFYQKLPQMPKLF